MQRRLSSARCDPVATESGDHRCAAKRVYPVCVHRNSQWRSWAADGQSSRNSLGRSAAIAARLCVPPLESGAIIECPLSPQSGPSTYVSSAASSGLSQFAGIIPRAAVAPFILSSRNALTARGFIGILPRFEAPNSRSIVRPLRNEVAKFARREPLQLEGA